MIEMLVSETLKEGMKKEGDTKMLASDFPRNLQEMNIEDSSPIYIITRNKILEEDRHPITGVEFERKIVDTTDGKIEGVFPKFESNFDAEIHQELYKESDSKQFEECIKQLKDKVSADETLRATFTEEQLEQIEDGETPDGYVWHHDAEPGKIQLVDFEIHAQTGHTGGRSIWGGGNENR